MKLEVHPEVARMERRAARLLYILGAFALVLSALVIYEEYTRWQPTPIKSNVQRGIVFPSAAASKVRGK